MKMGGYAGCVFFWKSGIVNASFYGDCGYVEFLWIGLCKVMHVIHRGVVELSGLDRARGIA
jgi:hypothetical protein